MVIEFRFRNIINIYMLLGVALCGLLSVYFPIASIFFYLILFFIISMYMSPKRWFLVCIALLPLYNTGFEYILKQRITYPIYYIAIFFTFCAWILKRQTTTEGDRYVFSGLHALSIFFVLWSGIALVWSINIYRGVPAFLELISGLLIFLLVTDLIRTKEDIRQLLGFLIGVGCILAAITFSSYWFSGEKTIEITDKVNFFLSLINEKGRPAGFTGVNHAATILNFFIFSGLSFFFLTEGKRRLVIPLAIFFLMVIVVMTGSKSGFGGLIIGLFLLNLTLPLIKGWRISSFFIIVCVLVLSFFLAMLLTGEEIARSRVTAVGTPFSYETRFEWWSVGFREFFKTCGIGLGTGGMREMLYPVLFTHNIFLSALFDLGIVGFGIFSLLLLSLFSAFKKAIKICADKQLEAVLLCMFAAMVGYLINNILQGDYYNRIFWLILGLDAAIIKVVYTLFTSKNIPSIPPITQEFLAH